MMNRSDSKYVFRRIQFGDVDHFRQIRLRALKDSPHAFMSTYASAQDRSHKSWADQVQATTNGDDRITYLCFENSFPVGIAALYRKNTRAVRIAEVMQVWVDPAHRNKGIARELMTNLISWSRSKDYIQLYATIHIENADVLPFYYRLGFYLDSKETDKAPDRDIIISMSLRDPPG